MTIEVTQADRDAAAAMCSGGFEVDVIEGRADLFDIVQSFARHRLAERTRCAQIARDQPGKVLGSDRYNEACEDVARAIVKTENNACPTDTGRA